MRFVSALHHRRQADPCQRARLSVMTMTEARQTSWLREFTGRTRWGNGGGSASGKYAALLLMISRRNGGATSEPRTFLARPLPRNSSV
jgi:hypothetical protein